VSRQIIRRNDAVSPVVATILLVAITVVLAAVLYVTLTSLLPPAANKPIMLGATIGTTGDGRNWTVTFVSVPLGLSPATTFLSVESASGAVVLANNPLSALTGGVVTLSGTTGKLFIQYRETAANKVSTSDVVLLGTTLVGTTNTTRGFQVDILTSSNVLFSGTLL
jgi:flagellin-like protein